jgi:Leucine-rich repeat (LRR) protein
MKLIGIIFVLSVPFAASLVIDCEFTSELFTGYFCTLIKDPIIIERDTVVTAAYGNHENSKNHVSVTSFMSWNLSYTMNFMPGGLNDAFPNLERIYIQNNHLKEIRRTDLQPFPMLTHLYLGHNDIETIEPDLFKHNPQLQVIDVEYNKIKRVHPNVFDHLNQLRFLYMDKNTCANERGADGRAEVLRLITKIKDQCNDVNLWTNN